MLKRSRRSWPAPPAAIGRRSPCSVRKSQTAAGPANRRVKTSRSRSEPKLQRTAASADSAAPRLETAGTGREPPPTPICEQRFPPAISDESANGIFRSLRSVQILSGCRLRPLDPPHGSRRDLIFQLESVGLTPRPDHRCLLPKIWLCGEKGLDHLLQPLNHEGWSRAFLIPPGAPNSI